MSRSSPERLAAAVDLLIAGQDVRRVAVTVGLSPPTVVNTVVGRIGHGCSVLYDDMFAESEHAAIVQLDYMTKRLGYRKNKTLRGHFAMMSIRATHANAVVGEPPPAVVAGILRERWTTKTLVGKALEVAALAPPRWPVIGEVTRPKVASTHILFGQTVTTGHLAELAGTSKKCIHQRLAKGVSPEDAIRRTVRA